MRILLALDSDSLAAFLDALLTARGFEVARERSGERALDALVDGAPAAIVIGEVSGGMSAIELVRQVRERAPDLPAIVLAAGADDDLRGQAMEAGATGFYTIPVSPSALVKELESVRSRP